MNRFQRRSDDGGFTYKDWKLLFERDVYLYNYLGEEKRTLFKRYIKYAEEVGVNTIEEDKDDRFENVYRVVLRATKDLEKLVDELMDKMAKARMKDDCEEAMHKKRSKRINELERKYANGGPTLFDFESINPADGGQNNDG